MTDLPNHLPAPRVSVVIPAFNAATFIEQTLATAQRQTLTTLEIIVVDDGSSDGTAAVVGRAAAVDSRVRLITQPNRGLSAARNRGIAEARGDFIAFLDHDDLWQPDKLALQVAVLDRDDEIAVASCYSAIIDQDHRCVGWRYGGDANGHVYQQMLQWDMVSGGSVATIRRTALAAVGEFDETLHVREDWDMWIRLARRFPFATVPRTLVGYTRRPSNASRDYDRMLQEGTTVLAKVSREDPGFGRFAYRFCRARDCFAVAGFCAIDGETSMAWRFLRESVAWTVQPIVWSPRRWAFVVALLVQTVVPEGLFRSILATVNRLSFQLPPGLPFHQISESSR